MDQATAATQASASQASSSQQPLHNEDPPSNNPIQEDANATLTETVPPSSLTATPVPLNAQTDLQSTSNTTTSLHRISTPTLLPTEESFVESWIQQSLTMPSATNSGDGEASSSFHIDAGVPSTRHRRERSLGSGFFVESDYSGIFNTGLPTSTSMSNIPAQQSSITDNANSSSSHHHHSSSHPFFRTSDFQNSWSNHSVNTTSGGATVMPNGGMGSSLEEALHFSSPSILGATMMPLTPSSDRPLVIARGSSTSPLSRDDEHAAATTTSSVIHDAARITSWETVIELCQSQPEAAAYIGRDGWTALHHACNRRCPVPEAVEALIKAYPDALLVEEEKGWLPLHYACRFKAPKEVVRLLLHMYPEKGRFGVSRPDRKGRTPLWYAVRYDAPAGVAGLLLEVDPSAVLEEDQNSETPLAVVWDQHAEKLDGKRALNRILGVGMDEGSNHHDDLLPDNQDNNAIDSRISAAAPDANDLLKKAKTVRKRLEGQKKWMEKWNTVNVFLKAAFGFALDDDWEIVDSVEEKKDAPSGRRWRILHAIAAIKCHHSLFSLASALHPEQAFEVDDHDLKRMDKVYQSCGVLGSPVNLTALHLAAASPSDEEVGKMIVVHLLSLNPQAARSVDSEGSTPLHRMAGNRYKSNWLLDGVSELVAANTDAVRSVDMHGCLPLHHAAKSITYFNGIDDEVVVARSKICHLLTENEDGAHHADNHGCFPLHLVAQNGKGWDAQVEALYNTNQAAVRARTGVKCGNRLPLHMAARNPASEFSMISRLVELNPRGASQADRKGMYPLHLACEVGLCWKSVAAIHEAYPEAIRLPEHDDRGWRALHFAAFAKNADQELVSNLVQLCSEAALIADKNKRFPLHLACMAGKTWETGLSTLFDANPNAITCPDKNGLLPLHIVCFLYAAEKASEPSGPKVIDVRSRRLSKTAASLEAEQATARELEEAKKIGNLFNLIRADPTVLSD